jgi:hypothetical protein
VIRENNVRAIADDQVFADGNFLFLETVELVDEVDGVDDDTVSDDAGLVLAKNAGWDEVQDVLLLTDDDRVAGVIPALATDNDVGFVREEVDDLSFSFVTPLGAN